jgi:hypothetical protein
MSPRLSSSSPRRISVNPNYLQAAPRRILQRMSSSGMSGVELPNRMTRRSTGGSHAPVSMYVQAALNGTRNKLFGHLPPIRAAASVSRSLLPSFFFPVTPTGLPHPGTPLV